MSWGRSLSVYASTVIGFRPRANPPARARRATGPTTRASVILMPGPTAELVVLPHRSPDPGTVSVRARRRGDHKRNAGSVRVDLPGVPAVQVAVAVGFEPT